ncbi:GmrSD restriction endonuclease domain-containing protein [Pseudomonas sp. S2_C03]
MSNQQKSLKSTLDLIQQKARERTVKTQNVEYDLFSLQRLITKNIIKLDPDYQRRHRWPIETSSRLIESLILNIPIPIVFISQDIDVDEEIGETISRYTVIDGQQRLTAIYNFLNNDYALEGLEALPELDGMRYNDLPPFLLRRLEERTVKCLRIDSTVDEQVKFDIFERLNTGSIKLEAQELRNATARGPFNLLIKELAKNKKFRQIIQINEHNPGESSKVKKMEDVELVLRFFALIDKRYLLLKKGFKDFLTDSLNEFNLLLPEELDEASKKFIATVDFIHDAAGSMPFAKYRLDKGEFKKMSSFNAAVYDAVMVGTAECLSTDEMRNPANQRKLDNYIQLFADNDFFAAVSGSVNDAAKVATRINAMIGFIDK